MNAISEILREKKQFCGCALVPFVMAGYPSIFTTVQVLCALDQEGVDVIELGIPYVDALADGHIIQKASSVAIKQGIYIDQVLSILDQVYLRLNTPIVIFSYYNPILARGINKFIIEISNFGIRGLVIPDLPIEEANYLIFLCSKYNIELILFIAPTSSNHRILNIVSKAPGCLYLVSNTGVTGIRDKVNSHISTLSHYIKSKTDKPIMLGFGISNAIQASQISKWDIDGIVIGSAIIRIISEYHCQTKDMLKNLSAFCKTIKSSIED